MKNRLARIACLTLIAAAMAATPAVTFAADTNTPAATAPAKKSLPFHGKVASVDAAAMTFTVGTTTIAVASTTKITKDGKPAVFSDITVGEAVKGSYKKDGEGKYTAASVTVEEKKKAGATDATAK